ncbi:hypothetical protein PFISCL1PPCAC_6596, partial [Pristionchus fissidentatus]
TRFVRSIKVMLLPLLLVFLIVQVAGEKAGIFVSGTINCLDNGGLSRPVTEGTVELMELDFGPYHFFDSDDRFDQTNFTNSGQFNLRGSEREVVRPQFFLKFNLPCPPISYCKDPIYQSRCWDTTDPTIEFTYLTEESGAEEMNGRRLADLPPHKISCYIGVKVNSSTIDGLSCIERFFGRARKPVMKYFQ